MSDWPKTVPGTHQWNMIPSLNFPVLCIHQNIHPKVGLWITRSSALPRHSNHLGASQRGPHDPYHLYVNWHVGHCRHTRLLNSHSRDSHTVASVQLWASCTLDKPLLSMPNKCFINENATWVEYLSCPSICWESELQSSPTPSPLAPSSINYIPFAACQPRCIHQLHNIALCSQWTTFVQICCSHTANNCQDTYTILDYTIMRVSCLGSYSTGNAEC